mgnify:FL=1
MQVFFSRGHLLVKEGIVMKENRQPMRVALLGLGTVGRGVYDYILAREDMELAYVLSLTLFDGITCKIAQSIDEILRDDTVDTVVEVIGGLHPAYEWVTGAIRAGKNVITANKLLIAAHYRELVELTAQYGVALRCTAAAGGGIPWLTTLERTIHQEPVTRISGIMNGTTNFILDTMHTTGGSFESALAEAQRLGYAERDPSADISGADIRRKLVISSNIAYGRVLREEDVDVFGIETITDADIAAFRRMGRVCKLFAASRKLEDATVAYIEPSLMTPAMPESAIPTNNNIISLTGERIGKQSFYGQGAGRYPTAYNVLQDCVDVCRGLRGFYTDRLVPTEVDNSSVRRRYYVRTNGLDKWLQSHVDKMLDCGIITKEVSVAEIHAWARERKQSDPGCFIASLR